MHERGTKTTSINYEHSIYSFSSNEAKHQIIDYSESSYQPPKSRNTDDYFSYLSKDWWEELDLFLRGSENHENHCGNLRQAKGQRQLSYQLKNFILI